MRAGLEIAREKRKEGGQVGEIGCPQEEANAFDRPFSCQISITQNNSPPASGYLSSNLRHVFRRVAGCIDSVVGLSYREISAFSADGRSDGRKTEGRKSSLFREVP